MRSIAAVTSQCAICFAGKYNGEEITVAVQEKHVPRVYARACGCVYVCVHVCVLEGKDTHIFL